MDKMTLKMTDKNGMEKEYEILLVFKWMKTNKNYVIYTDDVDADNANIFASIYDPNDSTRLDNVETEEEWAEIENRLKEIWR